MNNQVRDLIPYALVGLFVSLPLLALLVVLKALQDASESDDYKPRYFVYFMLVSVVAMINTTKSPTQSDLAYYYWLYDWAGSKSLEEYLLLIPKEPIYHIYNYIIRFITFGEFKLFVIITTFLMYFPVMVAFDIIIRKSDLDPRLAIYASITLVLFPQYFVYTMQIIRQVLAGSIAFYCVVKSIYSKSRLAMAGVFMSGFIHASAFLFSFYSVFQLTQRWSLAAKVVLLVLCGAVFYVLLDFISASGTEDESTLTYAARRGLGNDVEDIHIGMFPRLVCLSIFPLGLLSAFKIEDYRFRTFVSVSWLIVGIIILKWNTPLMVLRFMEYSYMYLPIFAVIFLAAYKMPKIIPIITLGMLAFFFYSLPRANFAYLPLSDIMINGTLMYFIF